MDEDITLTSQVETSDWRYAAAVVGMIEYFDFNHIPYNREAIDETDPEKRDWDILRFNGNSIEEEMYLKFVEHRYAKDMHHKVVESYLSREEFSEEEVKFINQKLTFNTVLKKHFAKLKFDGTNQKKILDTINEHRYEIVKETYRNKSNLYRNFCNTNQLMNDAQTCCRLNGYYIDGPKKGKSISYNFNSGTYVASDSKYFDFIPFAFSIGRESFFVNDNFSIKTLISTNRMLQRKIEQLLDESDYVDVRKVFFQTIIESADFIDHDVEVIVKHTEQDYFETLYLRKKSIRILKSIKNFKVFCFSYKVSDSTYINVQEHVTKAIVNMVVLDDLIEFFLKEGSNTRGLNNYGYLLNELIHLNARIRETINQEGREDSMKQSMKVACACAGQVVRTLESRKQSNKIMSYRTKLTSAIVFKDYKRFCDILMQLANYCDVQFTFAYELFENFEENKDLAYAFVNALASSNGKNE